MRTKLFNLWYRARSSFWFLPTMMVIFAFFIYRFAFIVDTHNLVGEKIRTMLLYTGGADGARGVLSSIAGSMITVAGVVFSITIVALSLASSQFGPRLIRNFMNDKGTQAVLGTFIANFIYCILVLRTIRGGDDTAFIPHFSVTLAIGMSFAGVGVLIYFIHHVSSAIQVNNVIATVVRDLEATVDRLYPQKVDRSESEEDPHSRTPQEPPEGLDRESRPITSTRAGYLQAVDLEGLLDLAEEKDLVLRVLRRPGHFISREADIVHVWPGERLNVELSKKVNAAFITGTLPSLEWDIEFAVNQITEIALRALSPGINDAFTAVSCIDWLGSSLCTIAGRERPTAHHYRNGELRVVTTHLTFHGLLDAAFNQIRQNSRSHPAVIIRLLETIKSIAPHVQKEEEIYALERHALMIERGSRLSVKEEWDMKDVRERYDEATGVIERVRKKNLIRKELGGRNEE